MWFPKSAWVGHAVSVPGGHAAQFPCPSFGEARDAQELRFTKMRRCICWSPEPLSCAEAAALPCPQECPLRSAPGWGGALGGGSARPRGRRGRGGRCRQPHWSGAAAASARCECGASTQLRLPGPFLRGGGGRGPRWRAGSGRVSPVPCPAVCAALGSPAGLCRLCPAAPPSPLRPPPLCLSSLPSLPRWLRRGSGAALLPCVCFGGPWEAPVGGARSGAVSRGRCAALPWAARRGDLPLAGGLLDAPLLYMRVNFGYL